MKSDTIVFTDGSSRGNPGPGGWASVIEYNDARTGADRTQTNAERKVTELGGREKHTTNNRMELTAAINALDFLQSTIQDSRFTIQLFTDSNYLINGITKWVFGWSQNGWMTAQKKEVENRDLWETLMRLAESKKISWKHVDGHASVPGNERCDQIATAFADGEKIDLYNGKAEKYTINLSIIEAKEGVKKSKSGKISAKAYSYLSLVDGKFKIHKTWAECEVEVKGKRGARFKKSFSAEDEQAIKKEWGI